MKGNEVAHILQRSKHVMFDFDGPVCSVFAGRPASEVANRLRKLVEAAAVLPADLAGVSDPMLFLYAAPMLPAALGEQVRQAFHAEELAAVETAEPTPGAHDAITECFRSGKVVTVVSNNSASAVEAYLKRHGLEGYVSYVSARRSPDPGLLKPSPYLLVAAIEATRQQSEQSVLIGDSVTDIKAARAVGSASIGYANKPGKRDSLKTAGADAIVANMNDVARSFEKR